jgi:hypothetical protein
MQSYHKRYILLFIVCFGFMLETDALTEVILTRSQFNDFAAEMAKIAMDIDIENATIGADLSALEQLVKEQNAKFDTMIEQNGKSMTLLQNSLTSLRDIKAAIDHQTERDGILHTEAGKLFTDYIQPISTVLNGINNAINIVKEAVNAIQNIFDLFQGTQDEAVDAIQVAVEQIATNFEIGMKGVVASALTGSEMTVEGMVCTAFEGDACVYNPLGEGPVVCAGAEQEVCQFEGLVVEPVREEL